MPRTPAKKLRKAGKHGADKHAAEKHAAGKHAAGKHEAAKPVAKVARKLVAKVDPTKPHAARADSGASTRRPAIQALIRWDPTPFLLHEAGQRARAGFPPGHPVFRIEGGPTLSEGLAEIPIETVLTSGAGEGQVCLVAVRPGDLGSFRRGVLALVDAGVVIRVEAEPQA